MGTRNFTPEPPPERFGQIPRSNGLVFICGNCGRRRATDRDNLLKAFGERGIIREVCKRLRCSNCKRQAMTCCLTPWFAKGFGSPDEIEKLLRAIFALKPRGPIE